MGKILILIIKFIIYTWIRTYELFNHPSRAAYISGLGVICDLAMIYNKASFVLK